MTDKLYFRESIVELLEDLAAEKPQTSESELICGWFDDLYVPGFKRQDYTSDGWKRGIRAFEGCFTKPQLEALARFHAFYDGWLNSGVRDWAPVKEQAAKTLEVFR